MSFYGYLFSWIPSIPEQTLLPKPIYLVYDWVAFGLRWVSFPGGFFYSGWFLFTSAYVASYGDDVPFTTIFTYNNTPLNISADYVESGLLRTNN